MTQRPRLPTSLLMLLCARAPMERGKAIKSPLVYSIYKLLSRVLFCALPPCASIIILRILLSGGPFEPLQFHGKCSQAPVSSASAFEPSFVPIHPKGTLPHPKNTPPPHATSLPRSPPPYRAFRLLIGCMMEAPFTFTHRIMACGIMPRRLARCPLSRITRL